jgi:hypothetical protein
VYTRGFRGAGDAHVKMIIVLPPGPHFCKPRAISLGFLAQALLYGRIDKDAFHPGLFCRRLEQVRMPAGPDFGINVPAVCGDDDGRHHVLALQRSERAARRRPQPDIGIESNLMACMPVPHRATPRLCDVADQQSWPADVGGLARNGLQCGNEIRMAPVAVPGNPHDVPMRAVDWQRHGSRETALGIESDRSRLQYCRRALAGKEFLCRRRRILRVLDWRQRLRVQRAFILCCSGASPEYCQENCQKKSPAQPIHRGLHFRCHLFALRRRLAAAVADARAANSHAAERRRGRNSRCCVCPHHRKRVG